MPVFLIADVKVTDDAWIPEYASKVHDIVAKHGGVRRQGFWHQELLKLRESLAHLVGFIMRRAVCDASGALRVSFV